MLDTPKQEHFLKLPEVIARTGLSRSAIYLSIREGKFPQNVSLGTRSVAWIESEVDAWMQDRINQRSTAS